MSNAPAQMSLWSTPIGLYDQVIALDGQIGTVIEMCTPRPSRARDPAWRAAHPYEYITSAGVTLADMMNDAGEFITEPIARVRYGLASWRWELVRDLQFKESSHEV